MAKVKEGKKVNLRNTQNIELRALEVAAHKQHHKAGTVYSVHPLTGLNHVEGGFAEVVDMKAIPAEYRQQFEKLAESKKAKAKKD